MKATTATIDWTTDDRLKELLATGVANLQSGQDRLGRSFIGAMGKGTGFRMLKLREAMFAKESKRPRGRAKKKG